MRNQTACGTGRFAGASRQWTLGIFFFFLQNADGGDHTNGVDIDVMINRITANRIHEQLNNNLGR